MAQSKYLHFKEEEWKDSWERLGQTGPNPLKANIKPCSSLSYIWNT